jgi:hypothetical protein
MTFMHERILLDVPLKGDRDYLRMADLFPAIQGVAQQFGPLAQVSSVMVRRPLRHAIQVSFQPVEGCSGSFRIRHGGESISGWLVETNRQISRRVPYDSSPISAAAVSGPDFARILEPLPGFALLDILVSLAKILGAQLSPHLWWLCQLNLDTPFTERFPLEVRVLHWIGGRFTVFNILQGDTVIGTCRAILDGITI